jgi:hypothetical protein
VVSVTVTDDDGDSGNDSASVTVVNVAPTATDNTVTTSANTDKIFTLADFNFSDVGTGDTLSKVQITVIPGSGELYVDSNNNGSVNGTEVIVANEEVTSGEISNNQLKFKPATNESGIPYATFSFRVHDGTTYSDNTYVMTINVTSVGGTSIAPVNLGSDVSLTVATVLSADATGPRLYDLVVANQGPEDLVGASMVFESPADLAVELVDSGQLVCRQDLSRWTCDLPVLTVDDSVALRLAMSTTSVEDRRITFSVEGSYLDPNPDDNQVSILVASNALRSLYLPLINGNLQWLSDPQPESLPEIEEAETSPIQLYLPTVGAE